MRNLQGTSDSSPVDSKNSPKSTRCQQQTMTQSPYAWSRHDARAWQKSSCSQSIPKSPARTWCQIAISERKKALEIAAISLTSRLREGEKTSGFVVPINHMGRHGSSVAIAIVDTKIAITIFTMTGSDRNCEQFVLIAADSFLDLCRSMQHSCNTDERGKMEKLEIAKDRRMAALGLGTGTRPDFVNRSFFFTQNEQRRHSNYDERSRFAAECIENAAKRIAE